ncbi:MAG: hypothetical protein H7177_16545 [Rhizobacter sp.]|nr:hypothetical protein [Bacteriovorax sp.]
MQKLFVILLVTLTATATGLYFRPSYPLIGQLDWWNVLSKGYFVGSFPKFFGQGFIDESFWYVMRYTMGSLIVGLILAMVTGGKGFKPAKKKK